MDKDALKRPAAVNEPVIDFPTFQREEWLKLDAALSWAQACAHIGVSRPQLRRALDKAREHAGPDPLNVEGVCNGVRFHAERPDARRGVAWRFYLHRDVDSAGTRMANLRGHVHFDEGAPRRGVMRVVLRPWRWFRRSA